MYSAGVGSQSPRAITPPSACECSPQPKPARHHPAQCVRVLSARSLQRLVLSLHVSVREGSRVQGAGTKIMKAGQG